LPRLRPASGDGRRVVYFPSCLTRILGPLPGETAPPLADAVLDVLAAAGFDVAYPEGVTRLCCGMPFASKAYPEAARRAGRAAAQALSAASREGRDVVITDASPCAGTLAETAAEILAETGRTLTVLDFPAFWARHALARLPPPRARPGTAVLHPTCTLVKTGGLPDLMRVARAYAEDVVVPAAAECCGFAGDRGFLVPELTASATAREAAEVQALPGDAACYSTCRTCEIGMSRAVGRPYRSVVHLVREGVRGG
jgi:D-lactate dehydrogenase